MSPTKKEQTAATTALLIDIARSMFTEQGYAGIGLEDLAARADVTRGAIYHHFRSKQGLFEAVLDTVQADIASAIEIAAQAFTDPWDQLVAGCHAFLEAACQPSARRIMLIDGPAVLGWQRWRELDAIHSGQLLEAVLGDLAGIGALEPRLVSASAAMLSGAMNEAALWLARADVSPEDAAAAHETLDRLLRSILGGDS
ncbi:MAG: TetR/AcrR family transcriptional regulator [Thermomicrobiales bacterium]